MPFNSPISRRAASSDALLIIGMTNAISGRVFRARTASVRVASRFTSDIPRFSTEITNFPACLIRESGKKHKREGEILFARKITR